MPHVSADEDPLLDRLIFGYDGTNYRVVKVDTSGNLVAALNAGSSITVTQATAANLNATAALAADQNVQARGYGWIGSAWQKQPIPMGFSAAGSINYYNAALPAGTSDRLIATVPAGEFWRVTLVNLYVVSATITALQLSVLVASATVPLLIKTTPVTGTYYPQVCDVLLAPADAIYVNVVGATLNNTLIVRGAYWRIDTDQ